MRQCDRPSTWPFWEAFYKAWKVESGDSVQRAYDSYSPGEVVEHASRGDLGLVAPYNGAVRRAGAPYLRVRWAGSEEYSLVHVSEVKEVANAKGKR